MALFVGLMSVVAPDDVSAASPASEPEQTERSAQHRKPGWPRGAFGAEVAGGVGGFLLGGGAAFGLQYGVSRLVDPPSEDLLLMLAVTGAVGSVGSGLGVYWTGKATGGIGRLEMSVLGSTVGGVAGASAGIGLAVLSTNLVALIIAPPIGVILGTTAGGMIGYRNSADPSSSNEKNASVRPIVSVDPKGERSTAGISIRF